VSFIEFVQWLQWPKTERELVGFRNIIEKYNHNADNLISQDEFQECFGSIASQKIYKHGDHSLLLFQSTEGSNSEDNSNSKLKDDTLNNKNDILIEINHLNI